MYRVKKSVPSMLSPCAAIVRQHASVAMLLGLPLAALAAPVPPTFDLTNLDGDTGFVINGAGARDASGSSVSSAGDINGDGVDDMIIGAPGTSPNGVDRAGATFIVFGGSDLGNNATFELSDIDGDNGFVINGINSPDQSGYRVDEAGDINGDGVDDIVIANIFSSSGGPDPRSQTYVIFGATDVGESGVIELSGLDGDNGFAINSMNTFSLIDASASAAGDINGDNIDDLIIGARNAQAGNRAYAGQSYVVFGATNLGNSGVFELENLNGNNGFTLNGVNAYDYTGASVSEGGDINGDGMDDMIIGAGFATPDDNPFNGQTYVVFGGEGVGSSGTIELSGLDGSDGFVLPGVGFGDNAGQVVSSAGDINGDRIPDILIGGFNISGSSDVSSAGKTYVVFGGSDVGTSGVVNLAGLNGSNGFSIDGFVPFENSGFSLSNTGDINGDGMDDIIIGTFDPGGYTGDPFDLNRVSRTYVVFGGSDVGNSGAVELSSLDGNNGFSLTLDNPNRRSGVSVSDAGDINDDGVDDLLIGMVRGEPNALGAPGESFVVFMPLPDDNEAAMVAPQIEPGQTRFLSFNPGDEVDSFTLSLSAESIVLVETANDGTALDYTTNVSIDSLANRVAQTLTVNNNTDTADNSYAYIIQTLPAGEYLINVTPNAGETVPSFALSVEVLETCDVSDPALQKTLGNRQFALLSLPCQPPAGSTVNDLFNDDIEGEYFDGNSGTWSVFTWDPENYQYINPGPSAILEPGEGFWIQQVQANGQDVVLDLPEGSMSTRSTGAAASACTSADGCLAIPLYDGAFPINPDTNAPELAVPNLIGNPYDQPLTPFNDLRVTTTLGVCSIGSDGCTPTQATLPASGGADVLGNIAFTYNPELRDGLGDYEQVISGSELEPWQGFWVFQLPAGIDNNPVVRFPDLR